MNFNFIILYEDNDIIAINKPSGIPVIPERWDKTKLSIYESLNNSYIKSIHFYTVHRIDRDCSGLVIFAKNKLTHKALCIQFENRSIIKEYLAIVEGKLKEKSKIIDLPIAQRKKGPIRSIIKATGKPSSTYYELIEQFDCYALLKVIPHTGRPNQIRLHLATIGHPILYDPLYNKHGLKLIDTNGNILLNRLALHSYKLSFRHPKNNNNFELIAPLPSDFNNAINCLKTKP